MGTDIAADIVSENHSNNEQKLWRHVILNAFEDTRIPNTDRKSSLVKLDAHDWIASSKDFEQICWWAGWDPDEVKVRYYKALKKNEIKFTKKQIRWREYNRTWNILRNEKDKEKRKILRARIDNLRKNIFNCPNIFVTSIVNEIKV